MFFNDTILVLEIIIFLIKLPLLGELPQLAIMIIPDLNWCLFVPCILTTSLVDGESMVQFVDTIELSTGVSCMHSALANCFYPSRAPLHHFSTLRWLQGPLPSFLYTYWCTMITIIIIYVWPLLMEPPPAVPLPFASTN